MQNVMMITGANQGIGYYMAEAWLKEGNTAIVLDLCCDTIDELKESYPETLLTYVCDVRDEAHVKTSVDNAVNHVGHIDIAVHNACVCYFEGLQEHSADAYLHTFKVNFLGAVNMTKAILPHMEKRQEGRICYTSSGVGVTGYINISGYSSSKGAIEAFAKCMLVEHRHSGISFHILQPPLTNTTSASPLPVPKEFKADPKKVGYGLTHRILRNKFVIAPSPFDQFTVRMSYWFPRFMGRMLTKMTERVEQ